MCLYPRLILNRKYLATKKNGYNPPPLTDERLKYVPIGCGNCIECRKQKAQSWRVRLHEELRMHKHAWFVTLTFSEESLTQLCSEFQLTESNAIAGKAVRRFLERWRKRTKKSVKHWLITELGHEETERIHLHGIIFTEGILTKEYLESVWQYGRTDTGKYCNSRSINYIVKYVTKIDNDHKGYRAEIFASAGIGKNYISKSRIYNKFANTDTREYYTLPNGARVNLPIYYRNHVYSEQEREQLWINRIEEHKRYVMGIEIPNVDTPEGDAQYIAVREEQRKLNKLCGYGDDSKEWQLRDYNVTNRMLNAITKKEKGRCGCYLGSRKK